MPLTGHRAATVRVDPRHDQPRPPVGVARPSIEPPCTRKDPPTAQLVGTAAALLAVTATWWAGRTDLSLIDLLVLVGVGLVLPLAVGGGWAWLGAAVATGASLLLVPGAPAASLVVPWLVVASIAVARTARAHMTRHHAGRASATEDLTAILVPVYATVAGMSFAASRLGQPLFGTGEPIVELTAIHFSFAGAAALALARHAASAVSHSPVSGTGPVSVSRPTRIPTPAPARPGHRRWALVGQVAVLATAGAPLLVATGFVTHRPLPQVGGAIVMAVGVWCTAAIELHLAVTDRDRTRLERWLLGVSGLAIWVPMVLAVAWAASLYVDVPALSIPDMARTHGVVNAFGFVVPGLLARRLAR